MKYYLLGLLLAAVMTGCSQEAGREEKNAEGIKVEQKVKKNAGKVSALVCLDEGEMITCKLMTKRAGRERLVEFVWRSPGSSDDRDRTLTLPANHASTFDTRNKSGREKGQWKVTAKIDNEEVTAVFRID